MPFVCLSVCLFTLTFGLRGDKKGCCIELNAGYVYRVSIPEVFTVPQLSNRYELVNVSYKNHSLLIFYNVCKTGIIVVEIFDSLEKKVFVL